MTFPSRRPKPPQPSRLTAMLLNSIIWQQVVDAGTPSWALVRIRPLPRAQWAPLVPRCADCHHMAWFCYCPKNAKVTEWLRKDALHATQ